jgi:DNA-binding CsgD family transcriptional regulator
MNATATARALNMNNSTVEFHLTAAKEKTGTNPRSFFGLIALLETIEETT